MGHFCPYLTLMMAEKDGDIKDLLTFAPRILMAWLRGAVNVRTDPWPCVPQQKLVCGRTHSVYGFGDNRGVRAQKRIVRFFEPQF